MPKFLLKYTKPYELVNNKRGFTIMQVNRLPISYNVQPAQAKPTVKPSDSQQTYNSVATPGGRGDQGAKDTVTWWGAFVKDAGQRGLLGPIGWILTR